MEQKILIIEDETTIEDTVTPRKSEDGYTITSFNDSDSALQYVRQHPVAIALVDTLLGHQNCVTFFENLRGDGHRFPVIFIENNVNAEQSSELMRLGAYDIINKQDINKKLKFSIKNCLEQIKLKSRVVELESKLAAHESRFTNSENISLREFKQRTEREFIITQLKKHGGNISRMARSLEVDRTNLHKKLAQFEIKREQIFRY